ncbi:hypothetical protein D3C77_660810 [compost metagenome]
MQRNHLAFAEQRGKLDRFGAFGADLLWRKPRVIGQHTHAESLGESRDPPTDFADADQAQRFAAQLSAHQVFTGQTA